MKYKILIVLLIICIPITEIKANETEDILNNMKNKLDSIETELNNLNLLDDKYPIGSIYITKSDVNPSEILGGTWEAFGQGRTLVGVDDTSDEYSSSELIGGNNKITLNSNNLPAHTHTFTPQGTIASTFKGTNTETSSSGSHTHNLGVYESGKEQSDVLLGLHDIGQCRATNSNCGFQGRVMVKTSVSKYAYTQSAGAHTHSLTPAGNVISTFEGTSNDTSSTGSSESFDVQNPYITVYFWKRTK